MTLAAIFPPSISLFTVPLAVRPSSVLHSKISASSERRIMTPSVGMVDVQTPRLFLNVHSPVDPSENTKASGIFASFTIVAQPLIVMANIVVQIIFTAWFTFIQIPCDVRKNDVESDRDLSRIQLQIFEDLSKRKTIKEAGGKFARVPYFSVKNC